MARERKPFRVRTAPPNPPPEAPPIREDINTLRKELEALLKRIEAIEKKSGLPT